MLPQSWCPLRASTLTQSLCLPRPPGCTLHSPPLTTPPTFVIQGTAFMGPPNICLITLQVQVYEIATFNFSSDVIWALKCSNPPTPPRACLLRPQTRCRTFVLLTKHRKQLAYPRVDSIECRGCNISSPRI